MKNKALKINLMTVLQYLLQNLGLGILVFFLTGCEVKKEIPTFEGMITHVSVSNFIALNDSNNINLTFKVNSLGGDESAALDLAEFLLKRNTTIIVDGACTSACAFYLLAASQKVIIQKNSLVSFHTNSVFLDKYFKSTGLLGGAVNSTILENSKRASLLYSQQNLNEALFSDSFVTVEPICVSIGQLTNNIKIKYAVWVPTREYMKFIGFNISGYWPESPQEVKKLVGINFKQNYSWFYGNNKQAFSNLSITLKGMTTKCE